jgi:hypothetical protein
LWLDCPLFADALHGREAFQRLEPSSEIVGSDEIGQVAMELIVAVVMEASNGGYLDGAVHPFDPTVGPGLFHLGLTMLAGVLPAGTPEDVLHGRTVLFAVFELDAMVGEDRMIW